MDSLKSLFSLLLLQFTLLSIPQGLQAQVDPSIEWKEIRTEDAYWIFDAKHQELAEYYIKQFNRAKAEVMPFFKEPPRKVTFLLLDITDVANGSAQVSPHPIVRLYPVHPMGESSIGEFKDHAYELVVHEYTHILNMEPVHGWMTPLKYIFGSVAHPNMILPRWYTEGLAVYTESKITGDGGRLNSQYAQGIARSLTLENKWEEFPLSDINEVHPDWMGGSRAYLFGGILWDSITRDKGDEVIYKMNQSYSRRLPYLLDGVLEEQVGRHYNSQLERAYLFWKLGAAKQIKTVTSQPYLPGDLVTKKKGQFHSPKISPDGLWMAFYNNDTKGFGHLNLVLRHPKNGFLGYKPKVIKLKTKGMNMAWHPAGTGLVYEKLDTYNNYYNFFDLHYYDLRTKKSTQITKGERAHHPCFSATGDKLFYLQNEAGRKNIVMLDWAQKKKTIVYKGPIGDDLRYLQCASDNTLLFVEHKPGKDPHIARINIKSKSIDIAFDKFPVNYLSLSHKGALFSSSESGIENIYLLNQETWKKPKALTNSLTRAFHAEMDPLDDSLYFTQLSSDGFKLHRLKGAQWESLPDNPPKVAPIVDYTKLEKPKAEKPAQKRQAASTNTTPLKSREFSPWRYLYPNYWIPFVYIVDGGTLWQALTSAGDPLGINTISFTGQWDTLTKKAGGSISYVNNSTPVSLGVGVSDFYSYFYSTGQNLHFSNATFLSGYTFKSLDNLRLRFKWNYSALELAPSIFIRQGPQLELGYSATKRERDGISPYRGWRSQLGHKNYLADLGNVAYGETYAHLGTFWSSFTPGRSVFYLGINGSYAPKLNNGFFASQTLAGPFFSPQIVNTAFLQRGYPTGVFVARNIINANTEYRFPVWDMFSGFTSPPIFFKRIQGSLVFDATTLDGRYSSTRFATSQITEVGRWFTGYGLELETKVNMGFHVPVAFTLGVYHGEEIESFGGLTTFFNMRL